MIESLPHLNAALNALACILLVLGFIAIKRRNEQSHKRLMLSAFGVSTFFLISYLTYHADAGSKKFPREDYSSVVSAIYYLILASHGVLATLVPVLALVTIYFGFRGYGTGKESTDSKCLSYRGKHRRLAKWTFPVWIYVSITGVLVYLMLYHLFPPTAN